MTIPSVIYSFGDSLTDGGDAYLVSTSSYAQYASYLGATALPVSPPYFQETYPNGGSPLNANVFSNGPVWVQDLATSLGITAPAPGQIGANASLLSSLALAAGIPSYLVAGLIASLESSQHTTGTDPYLRLIDGAAGGTDFAIGGSVTGVTNANTDPTVPLGDLAAQIANFHAEYTTPAAGALYTVWSGANDLINLAKKANIATLIGSGAAATDIAQSATNVVNAISSLIGLGATDVLVMNVPDIGLAPTVLQLGTVASATASMLAQEFNTDLANDITAAGFAAGTVKLADVFSLIDNAVANPGSYGLTNVTDPLYTGGYTSFTPGDLASTVPSVQAGYLFFDTLHPTATGQSAIAALAQATLACFAGGTRIATPDGERPVETLRPGQRVTLHSGGSAEIRWIGHRVLDATRQPRPDQVWPIRVAPGAFGPGVPQRALFLSPDHAIWCAGSLIPVRYLVNGRTIAPARRQHITYWHVELDHHDVLLAEGLPCESYLDTGNRADFDNAGPVVRLHPDFAWQAWRERACAPLAIDGAEVEAARSDLLARAAELGHVLTDAPDLHLRVDGRRIEGRAHGRGWQFRVPAGARRVRLVSRSGVPAETREHSADTRRLGVAVAAIRHGGAALDLAAFDGPGWHAIEPDAWRWTDGDALLHVAAGVLDIEIAMVERYWREGGVWKSAGLG